MTISANLAETGPETSHPSEAVRKQVTVLFCDIANYTERTASMDPEELGEEIRQFQQICREVAELFHGNVSSYHGDGIMVLFGHPHASEFSPERAVRAGLEMVASIRRNNRSAGWRTKTPLAIRIGIATGLVVVGDRAGKERDQSELIFGNATNLAARLQDIAEPNSVVVALRTRRLVGLAFKFRELGEFNLKGFRKPVSAWQILHERKLKSRPGNILKRNTSQFISRQRELNALRREFEQACFGFSRFVHISGDPGIGKTRLVRAFEKSIDSSRINCIRISCSPYYQNSFLRPVSDECMRWLRISENDDLETRQASVNWAMSIVDLEPVEKYLLFTELLDIPSPNGELEIEISAEEKRHRTISALVRVFIAVSKSRPLLLVAEDLHWADPSTLALLHELMGRVREERVLGIFTSRSHFSLPWQASDTLTEMTLSGLTQAESRQLVESLFGDQYVPENVKQALIHKSDGVPLYLEECCLSALGHLQQSTGLSQPLLSYNVPETLQDSLNARLDQLGDAKAFAQLASVFAENFTYSMVRDIAALNGIDADYGLDILLEENILIQQPNVLEDQIKFRHVMFQEAAYQSLLIKVRQHYHRQIADKFVMADPEIARKHPELLAHHYSHGGRIRRAVELWLVAGEQAIRMSAIVESIDHLHKGLALVEDLDHDENRFEMELSLLLNLGVALTARSGYYGYEVSRTYQSAVALAETVGDDAQRWTAMYGLWRCHISRAEYGIGIRLGASLDRLAETLDEPILRLTTCGIKGMTRLVDGKIDKASRFTDRAVNYYNEVKDKRVGLRFGQDPFVTIQGLGAVAKLMCGRVHESVKDIDRSVAVARSIGHPYTIGETLKLASIYQQLSRNMEQLHLFAEEAIALSEQYGFDGILATHRIFLGFANLVSSNRLSSVDIIQDNLLIYEQKYGLLFLPYFQSVLAEALLIAGRFDEALDTATLMLSGIDRSGENWMRPKALCMKAEAALRAGGYDFAEINTWYCDALKIAADQGSYLMLGRALQAQESFSIDDTSLRRYRRLLAESDAGEAAAVNHEFITRRH